MREIALTVLFVDTVPARLYLALLKVHGYEPANIIYLDRGAQKIELTELDKLLMKSNGIEASEVSDYFDSCPKNKVTKFTFRGLDDEELIEHIKIKVQGAILFTGGGILSSHMLSIPHVKFIHIHPGVVPDIRGADCFYWSYLLRGKAGYSVFYMNEGIDTGDVLHIKEFDIDLSDAKLELFETSDVYLSILKYFDPCLRIITFIELLDKQFMSLDKIGTPVDLMNMKFVRQNPSEGRMYFFMHKDLRDFVIDKLKGQ